MLHLDALPNQLPGEAVILKLRRHWMAVLGIILTTIGLLLVPTVIGFFLFFTQPSFLGHAVIGPILLVLLAIYFILITVLTITNATDYWLDVWIVTNERIINSEQLGLFHRVVSEVKLHQIQDITSETRGFFHTFLTYGDVFIQTAAERERFHFEMIDNPDEVKVRISELSNICKRAHHHPGTEGGV